MIKPYSYGENTIASKFNNVIDEYKTWQAEEIRADLQPRRTQMVSVFENFDHNINIACGIRSNNAFLGKEVYVTGRRRFNRKGTVGTSHLETCYSAETTKEVIDYLHSLGYTVFAVDNIMEYNPENIYDINFPKKSAFVFGQESCGLSKDALDNCDRMVYIQQFGSVRSLNVACAASILMYEYTKQWR